MFPWPPSRSEIDAVLRPLLARCDAAGRRYVIELASVEPGRDTLSAETRQAMRQEFFEMTERLMPTRPEQRRKPPGQPA